MIDNPSCMHNVLIMKLRPKKLSGIGIRDRLRGAGAVLYQSEHAAFNVVHTYKTIALFIRNFGRYKKLRT